MLVLVVLWSFFGSDVFQVRRVLPSQNFAELLGKAGLFHGDLVTGQWK